MVFEHPVKKKIFLGLKCFVFIILLLTFLFCVLLFSVFNPVISFFITIIFVLTVLLLIYKKKIHIKIFLIVLSISLLIFSLPYIVVFSQSISLAKYRRNYPEYFKGVRFNTLTHYFLSLFDFPLTLINLKKLNVNSVYLIVFYKVNENGKISEIPFSKFLAKLQVRRFHNLGYSIALSPALLKPGGSISYGSLSEKILEKENFWENLEKVILDTAKLAEEEKVELFFILNEPEVVLGLHSENLTEEKCLRMMKFAKEILPKVKKVFKGKIGWHAALGGSLIYWNEEKNEYELGCSLNLFNFSGYDYYGSTIIVTSDDVEKERKLAGDLVRIQLKICDQSNSSLIFPETFWRSRKQIKFFEFYFNQSKEELKGSFITLAAFRKNEIIRTIEELYEEFL